MAESWRLCRLRRAEKALMEVTKFLTPALPFLNSHNVDFFVENHWDNFLPPQVKQDLESFSVPAVFLKGYIDLYSNPHWDGRNRFRKCENVSFNKSSLDNIMRKIGLLDLEFMEISHPVDKSLVGHFSQIRKEEINLELSMEDDLVFDNIMAAKKLHEVQKMGHLIYRVSKISTMFNSIPTTDLCSLMRKICDNDNQGEENIPPKMIVRTRSQTSIHGSVLKISTKQEEMPGSSKMFVNKPGEEKRLTVSPIENFAAGTGDVDQIVDIGSGKGFLSSFLALLYRFKVLGLERSEGNVQASADRANKLKKNWFKILARALERARAKKTVEGDCEGNNVKTEEEIKFTFDINYPSDNITFGDLLDIDYDFKNRKLFVRASVNLHKEIPELVPSDSTFGIVGLHTCGGLGADSIDLFLNHTNSKFLVNVPCCYHHLEEIVFPNSIPDDTPHARKVLAKRNFFDEEDQALSPSPNFPMSKFLQNKCFNLGRNARMLSSYTFQRMSNELENMEVDKPLIWRLLLQVIIKQKLGHTRLEYHVGKLGQRCKTFEEYVHKALVRLHLGHLEITKEEIDAVYKEYEPKFDRFHAYYIFRTVFASLIEACIILDRLVYLLEQPVVLDAFIVRAFDRFTSPRAHALVAFRAPAKWQKETQLQNMLPKKTGSAEDLRIHLRTAGPISTKSKQFADTNNPGSRRIVRILSSASARSVSSDPGLITLSSDDEF